MQKSISNSFWQCRFATLERCHQIVSIMQIASVVTLFLIINQISEALPNNTLSLSGRSTGLIDNGSFVDNKDMEFLSDSNNICFTPECIHTASSVLHKMKPNTDPCDDFYKFACGNYVDEIEIPDDEDRSDVFNDISRTVYLQMRNILTEKRPETELKVLSYPNILYETCLNESIIESLSTKPIKKISNFLGGWPVISGTSWDSENTWSWPETVKNFRRLGLATHYIVDIKIAVYEKNNTNLMITLDHPSLALSREILVKGFNNSLVLEYYNYMVDVAVLFGAKEKRAKIEMRRSLQFEIDLAKISSSKENRANRETLQNLCSIKELQESYPYFQWLDYINNILPESVRVDENEIVNLAVPSFIDDLGKLLQRTDKRVIANYVMWSIHESSLKYLTEKFRKRQWKIITVLTGKLEREVRWKECVGIVSNSLPLLTSSLYARKYSKPDTKSTALEMFGNLRNVFSQMLDKVKWMDENTKKQAKSKLHAMATHIGFPDELLDNDILEAYHRNLKIYPNRLLKSLLKINVFKVDNVFNRLGLPLNKTYWVDHAIPAVVNAYHMWSENSIILPTCVWQDRFYNDQRPKYMNYGSIGYIIGHEITHGFDSTGSQFDIDGNLIDWWEPDTKKSFLEKTKCFIEQYNKYTDKQTGLTVNGINTLSENIADNGGLKESYSAYNQWVTDHGKEPRLPGLNYTPNQMFWISFAQTWCAKYRTEYLKMFIITGGHSPYEFRVLGSLRNIKDFAQDFQCPIGTSMNPVEKCEVW